MTQMTQMSQMNGQSSLPICGNRVPAKRVDHLRLPLELGQLVQEQHPVVGQAHLPRPGMEPPPMRPASETEWCGERKGRVVTSWPASSSRSRAGQRAADSGQNTCFSFCLAG
jgi:hypothetical protein